MFGCFFIVIHNPHIAIETLSVLTDTTFYSKHHSGEDYTPPMR